MKDKPLDQAGYSFQDVHSDDYARTEKRLYMTATPRVYTAQSKRSMETKGMSSTTWRTKKSTVPVLPP